MCYKLIEAAIRTGKGEKANNFTIIEIYDSICAICDKKKRSRLMHDRCQTKTFDPSLKPTTDKRFIYVGVI